MAASAALRVKSEVVMTMQVATEDEEPLDEIAAEQGLVLRLAPAGRGRADEITVSMDPGAGILMLCLARETYLRCVMAAYCIFLSHEDCRR